MKKEFRVLRDGISQKQEDGSWTHPKIGDIIQLTPLAEAHLLQEGYVEPAEEKRTKNIEPPVDRRKGKKGGE